MHDIVPIARLRSWGHSGMGGLGTATAVRPRASRSRGAESRCFFERGKSLVAIGSHAWQPSLGGGTSRALTVVADRSRAGTAATRPGHQRWIRNRRLDLGVGRSWTVRRSLYPAQFFPEASESSVTDAWRSATRSRQFYEQDEQLFRVRGTVDRSSPRRACSAARAEPRETAVRGARRRGLNPSNPKPGPRGLLPGLRRECAPQCRNDAAASAASSHQQRRPLLRECRCAAGGTSRGHDRRCDCRAASGHPRPRVRLAATRS